MDRLLTLAKTGPIDRLAFAFRREREGSSLGQIGLSLSGDSLSILLCKGPPQPKVSATHQQIDPADAPS
jgi:hypothetical protein